MTNVLVTGGAGFVGIPTVRALQLRGFDVSVLDSFGVAPRERIALLNGMGVRVIEADIRNRDAVIAAIETVRPTKVVHLAAVHFIPYCIAHPAESLAVNVLGTQHVLDGVRAIGGVDTFTFASTADVYQPDTAPHHELSTLGSDNVYGQAKLIGEELVAIAQRQGLLHRSVVTRFFNVVGPGETNAHLVPDILDYLERGNSLPLGSTDTKRDYVFVEDVASVVATLTTGYAEPHITVNVGSGASYSAADIVTTLASITGRALTIDTDPAKVRKSDRPNLQADITKLSTVMPGFSPTAIAISLNAALVERSLISKRAA